MANQQRAMYHTLHHCEPAYQQNNQGLDCYTRWKEMLPPIEGGGLHGNILEMGCGNGLLCEFLTRMGYNVTGLDLVEGPYERRGYKFALCDIIADDLPHGFDVSLCFDILEHLPEHTIGDVLVEIGQTAKKLVLSAACYGSAPVHLTVQPPGWWLQRVLRHLGGFSWRLDVWHRYEDRPSQVVLLMGERT